MERIFKTILSVFSAIAVVFWIGCAEDEAKPENFKTQEAAETALFETEDDIFTMLEQLHSATDLAMNFDGSYPADFTFKTKRMNGVKKRLAPNSFGYNAQTGYWTFDTTASVEGLTLSSNGKIRFTPRDLLTGLPNESTNTMEFDMTASMRGQDAEAYIDLKYLTDLLVDGIASYRDTTGNATVSGSEEVDFSLDVTLDTEHLFGEYKHHYTIDNIVVSPTSSYPQSGRLDFTIKRSLNVSGYGQDFYVQCSIVFDGTNIAVLEFGGFTFHIDLDGPYIVEFLSA